MFVFPEINNFRSKCKEKVNEICIKKIPCCVFSKLTKIQLYLPCTLLVIRSTLTMS